MNNKTSSANPTVSRFVKPTTTVLSERDGDRLIWFLNADVDAELASDSEVFYPLGNRSPVQITQSVRGYEGSCSGELANDTFSLTAAQMKSNLEYFQKHLGMILRLSWVDQVLAVVIRNVTITPIAVPDGTTHYVASFDWFEADF